MDSDRTLRIARAQNAGFWLANGREFWNKAEALREASKTPNGDVQYKYFDALYNVLPNGVEPPETLDELYDARAKQIRDQYSYVILAVSGGADSTNMLRAFLRNNLRIDEIVAYYPLKVIEKLIHEFDPTDTRAENHMFEYNAAFLPAIELAHRHQPHIKVTVFDYTDDAISMIDGSKLDDVYHGGIIVQPGSAGPLAVMNHLARCEQPNATCVIANDKPRLYYDIERNKFFTHFIDFQNFWPAAFMTFKSPQTLEQFYYTPEMPAIVQKQYFVLRREMRNLLVKASTDPKVAALYKTLHRPHPTKPKVQLYNIQEPFFENLIYPTLNSTVFQSKKPASIFFMEDAKGLMDLTTERTRSFYEGQVTEFLAGIHPRFVNYSADGKPAIFKHISTQPIQFPE